MFSLKHVMMVMLVIIFWSGTSFAELRTWEPVVSMEMIWPDPDTPYLRSHQPTLIVQCFASHQPSQDCVCSYNLFTLYARMHGAFNYNPESQRYEANLPLQEVNHDWDMTVSCFLNSTPWLPQVIRGEIYNRIKPIIDTDRLMPPLPGEEGMTYVSTPVEFSVSYKEEVESGVFETFNDGECSVNYLQARNDLDGRSVPQNSHQLFPIFNPDTNEWEYKAFLSLQEGLYYVHFMCKSGPGFASSEAYPIMVGPPSLGSEKSAPVAQ